MTKKDILNRHLDFKRISVKHEPKLKDIERYLGMFINFKKKPLKQFNEDDLVQFINSLDYSVRTINDIKCYLKVFIKWHYEDYSSRFKNLDKLCKQQKALRAYKPNQMIKEDDFKKLVKGENDLMWKCYWTTFFYGGFRPSECANLKWNDNIFFEKEGVVIKILATKTKKEFLKTLPKDGEHLLKEWRKYNHSELVFPSPKNNGKPIRARSICARLKRLSKKTLGKEVVPYAMRHSFATWKYNDKQLKKKGLSDDDIANQMGHTKNMKMNYLNLDEDELKANARMLWIKTKPLPSKEREDLQRQIDKLKKDNAKLREFEKTVGEQLPQMRKEWDIMQKFLKENILNKR